MAFREGELRRRTEESTEPKTEPKKKKEAAKIEAMVSPEKKKEMIEMIRNFAVPLEGKKKEAVLASIKAKEEGLPEKSLAKIIRIAKFWDSIEQKFLSGNWDKQVIGGLRIIFRGRPKEQWPLARETLFKGKVSEKEITEAVGKKEESKKESKKKETAEVLSKEEGKKEKAEG